jgi:hypothetical protein
MVNVESGALRRVARVSKSRWAVSKVVLLLMCPPVCAYWRRGAGGGRSLNKIKFDGPVCSVSVRLGLGLQYASHTHTDIKKRGKKPRSAQ